VAQRQPGLVQHLAGVVGQRHLGIALEVRRTDVGRIATGALVAVARIAGETAPLLFTAFGNQFWHHGLGGPSSTLPVQIYTYAISPFDDWHRQAWAGALVLLTLIALTSLSVRLLTRGRFRTVR